MAVSPAAISSATDGTLQSTAGIADQIADMRLPASELTVSQTMQEVLAEEEGVHLTVYRDTAGFLTVGVGHRVTKEDGLQFGDQIDYDQALRFLEADLAHAEQAAERLTGDLPLYQHEYDALVGLVFNIGEGNVTPRQSPNLNRAIAASDYPGIAEELAYHYAGGALAEGLMYRSERRQAIFSAADYDDPRPANARLASVTA